jgi:hypothetical protein
MPSPFNENLREHVLNAVGENKDYKKLVTYSNSVKAIYMWR